MTGTNPTFDCLYFYPETCSVLQCHLNDVEIHVIFKYILDEDEPHCSERSRMYRSVESGITEYMTFEQFELNMVSSGGHRQLVDFILDKHVHISQEELDKSLRMCVERGTLSDMVRLIDRGAKDFDSALKKACHYGDETLIRYLLTKVNNVSGDCMYNALRNCGIETINMLLRKSDQNYHSSGTNMENLELVKFVANSNRFTTRLNNMLTDACIQDSLEAVDYLVSIGAKYTNTTLMYALLFGRFRLVKLRVENGVTIGDDSMLSAVNLGDIDAVTLGDIDIVKYLVSVGGKNFSNCFLAANRNDNLDIMKYLVQFVDISVVNDALLENTNYKDRPLKNEFLIECGASNIYDAMVNAAKNNNIHQYLRLKKALSNIPNR